MKKIKHIRLISDLHLEFSAFSLERMPEDEETLLVLAGDVAAYNGGVLFIHLQCRHFASVLYVLGNHEHYNGNFQLTEREIEAALESYNLSHLVTVAGGATKIEFDGLRILAGTLWTDLNNDNVLTHATVSSYLNDYKVISNGSAKLTTEDTYSEFQKTISQFDTWLKEDYSGKTVIVTHHMPSDKAVAFTFKNDYHMNGGFRSDLDSFIEKYAPSMWLFGHTHSNCDIMVSQTRLLCNPRGYPRRSGNYENLDFNPNLIINLD